MSAFKTANEKEREAAIKNRNQKGGLSYIKGNFEFYRPQDGDNQIRIVPPLAIDNHAELWGLPNLWTYFLENRSYVSSQTFGKHQRDPISEHFFRTRKVNEKEAERFRGNKRYLMWILDTADESKLKLWDAPPTLVDEFIGLSKDRRAGRTGQLVPLEDPEKGRIIYFTRTGSGLGTRYSGVERDSEAHILDEAVAEQIKPFEEIVVVPTPEELDEILQRMKDTPMDDEIMDDEIGGEEDASNDSPISDAEQTRERVRKAMEEKQKAA